MKLEEHGKYMAEAIKLAASNLVSGDGGPFGAVVVKDGQVIASARNRVIKDADPTAHAEILAIREACRELGHFQLDDCDLYTSCEPCPMCLGAIYWARPRAVYYAGSRDDAASAGFDDAFIYDEINMLPDNRRIPAFQLMRDEAKVVFIKWNELDNKIPY